MVELFANSGNPDQTPRSATSDLGLHCLSVARLGVPSLQWIKEGGKLSILTGRTTKTFRMQINSRSLKRLN